MSQANLEKLLRTLNESGDNEAEPQNVDIIEITWLLKSFGFKMDFLDFDPSVVKPNEPKKTLNVVLTCNTSGIRSCLSYDLSECKCPAKKEDTWFCEIQSASPDVNGTGQLARNASSSLLPEVSASQVRASKAILANLLAFYRQSVDGKPTIVVTEEQPPMNDLRDSETSKEASEQSTPSEPIILGDLTERDKHVIAALEEARAKVDSALLQMKFNAAPETFKIEGQVPSNTPARRFSISAPPKSIKFTMPARSNTSTSIPSAQRMAAQRVAAVRRNSSIAQQRAATPSAMNKSAVETSKVPGSASARQALVKNLTGRAALNKSVSISGSAKGKK